MNNILNQENGVLKIQKTSRYVIFNELSNSKTLTYLYRKEKPPHDARALTKKE